MLLLGRARGELLRGAIDRDRIAVGGHSYGGAAAFALALATACSSYTVKTDYDPTVTYQQFRGPVHCADVSNDGLVYVCDRTSDRLQIFKTDGTFVKEVYIARDSRGDGAVWDVAFSRDKEQKYLYVADGRNQKLRIFDRQSMEELTNFGKGGHYPGEWYSLHNIATDSKPGRAP